MYIGQMYRAKEWEKVEAWHRIGKGKFWPENFLNPTDWLVYEVFQNARFSILELRGYLQKYYVFEEYDTDTPSVKFEIISLK